MKKTSKNLNSWATSFFVTAIVMLLISVVGFCMDSSWTQDMFNGAIICFAISPLFRGFSVLVQNAEEQIEEREKEELEDEE